jgi:hypothetical protein
MLKLPTHSGFHDLFLNYSTWIISSPAAVALLYHVMQLTWLKGSGFVKGSNLLAKPLPFKTGYITSRDS